MSLINQMLRDLDSREAGTREPVTMPPPVASTKARRTGPAWKGIVLLLAALSLLAMLWFSPVGESSRERLPDMVGETGTGLDTVAGTGSEGTATESRVISEALHTSAAAVSVPRQPELSGPARSADQDSLRVGPVPVSGASAVDTPGETGALSGEPALPPGVQSKATGITAGGPAGSVHMEAEGRDSHTTASVDSDRLERMAETREHEVVATTLAVVEGMADNQTTARRERQDDDVESKSRSSLQVQQAEQKTGGQLPAVENGMKVASAKEEEKGRSSQIRVTRATPEMMRQSAEGAYREAREQLEQGDVVEAERALRHALSLESELHPARHLLSMLRWQQGDRQEAEAVLREGLEMRPLYVPFVVLMGRMMVDSGELARARLLLQQSRPQSGDDPDLLSLLGSIHQQEGRFMEAASVYRELLVKQPADARTLAGLAIALDAQGEHEEALTRYRDALAAGQLPAAVRDYARQRVAALTSEH